MDKATAKHMMADAGSDGAEKLNLDEFQALWKNFWQQTGQGERLLRNDADGTQVIPEGAGGAGGKLEGIFNAVEEDRRGVVCDVERLVAVGMIC